jgi:hypothetical protein
MIERFARRIGSDEVFKTKSYWDYNVIPIFQNCNATEHILFFTEFALIKCKNWIANERDLTSVGLVTITY